MVQNFKMVLYYYILFLTRHGVCFLFFQEETRKKPKMTIVESAQPGSEPLCTVDV